jgi:penicillin G amidase
MLSSRCGIRSRRSLRVRFVDAVVALAIVAACSVAECAAPEGKVEVLRDTWGIPHVFADTDAGAMYGLGYVTAQERGFQMTYSLRIIQGRLAEVVGDRARPNGRDTAVSHDRRMRTYGWARAAARTAANLDAPTRELMAAYCDGVNDSFAAQGRDGTLHPLFTQLGVAPEPWTPADCLLSWWHLAQFFATDGTRDLMMWRNRTNPPPEQPQQPKPGPLWFDDATAVVQRGDVSDAWLKRVEEYCAAKGIGAGGTGEEGPKFSHAWVVGGSRTTTGAAVLVSDPQTQVRNPALWMEFHISGKTFNARGIGVPGSPGLLLGFTPRVAWGLSAMGADQADLFRLETDPARPDEYRWDGQWRKMDVRTEIIKVKGAADAQMKVRETHFGPVVSEFSYREKGDPEVALKRVPMCDTDRDTIQGVLGMLRAKDATEFAKCFGDWRFPSVNCVYGDMQGHIGFATLGAIPLRAKTAPDPNGNCAMPGTGDADDWRGFVPQDLLPHVVDPKAGLLWSANHRPIGAFYRIPLGISTGSMGDTIRSWRLRELLAREGRFTPEDVLQVHFDAVNPARRNIVRLGLHMRDTGQGGLSEESLKALNVLEKWHQAGASSDLTSEGAALATQISTFFRMMATPVALKYGGGESGLARFLKDAAKRIDADPKAPFDPDGRAFVDNALTGAWRASGSGGGPPASSAARKGVGGEARGQAPANRGGARLGWFESLDGYGSLDPAQDLRTPGITDWDGQTIHCQSAQSYTQFVPMHDPDAAQTICPIGHSDRPDGRFRQSTMALWGEAKLHPAPLSRAAVEKLVVDRIVLGK